MEPIGQHEARRAVTPQPPTPERRRFQRDVVWNLASFALLGVAGITLNVLIGWHYRAEGLGVFNQVVAAYIVFSMLATAGIHMSVLRSVAEADGDEETARASVLGALLPAVLLSGLVTLVFLACAGPLAALLKSEGVGIGMQAAAPGLFFFGLNKTLLAVENGRRRMRAFAVFQSLRYVLILGAFLVAWQMGVEGPRLPLVFTVAEAILFPVLLFDVSRNVRWWRGKAPLEWSRRHLRFGLRNMLSGMLLELNSRVDILMLGFFRKDEDVGIYSFAALFAEGFYQLFVVLQNNYNPVLAGHLARGERAEVEALVRRGRKATWYVGAAAGLAAVLVYPFLMSLLTQDPAFGASRLPFALLVGGLVLAAGYLPFQGFLAMANLPGWHTVFMFQVVFLNAVLNVCAIPLLGVDGAALATGASFGLSVLILRAMARRLVGVKL